MNITDEQFHLPQKPFSVIDAINRYAAGQGSVRYAQQAADSDYNGHHITVGWNTYRGYYIAEYFWGGRNVIARSTSAEEVLRAAVEEFKRQGRGARLTVLLKPEDVAVAAKFDLIAGQESAPEWFGPMHKEVSGAFGWQRDGIIPTAVSMLANSKTVEEYKAKIEDFCAERRARMQTA